MFCDYKFTRYSLWAGAATPHGASNYRLICFAALAHQMQQMMGEKRILLDGHIRVFKTGDLRNNERGQRPPLIEIEHGRVLMMKAASENNEISPPPLFYYYSIPLPIENEGRVMDFHVSFFLKSARRFRGPLDSIYGQTSR